MCYTSTCTNCNKTIWKGCGREIEPGKPNGDITLHRHSKHGNTADQPPSSSYRHAQHPRRELVPMRPPHR
ncbi:hypothetical protein BC936DRAFT_137410 [Jimgerdemannia flammicorona]|uniref:Uncharacterized protein n=1 Tax=Jimgerdemannia flammicorona TaxID=994334 RepID=A0A433CXG1_9FUNG|nr:hypothetical protein BC936DRAFT_137410 [Jimgerdemannia flammicorona]